VSSGHRILSIDGGGIKGVFAASFLASLESSTGCRIVDNFDLIAGTSTGGIIAIALGLGYSAADILSFYEQLGPEIFQHTGFASVMASIKQLGKSKYGQEQIAATLNKFFGGRTLGESKTALLIPSFNIETGEIYAFRSGSKPPFDSDSQTSALDAALATTAAPTYFPAHRTQTGTPLVDGAVWANNPTELAVVEGIGSFGWIPDSISVLSVGSTQTAFSAGLARSTSLGAAYWGMKAADLFMTAQSSAALLMAGRLIGPENVHRYNPTVPARRFGLDKISEIPSLKGLGDSEVRKALPTLRKVFFSEEKSAD
jgi:patatin-like phospholipase/acyl hydrolase